MSTSLQAIAESLGQRLQRSVAIDDPSLHLLAHSPHYGEVDDTRLTSILQLQPPDVARDFVQRQGIAAATRPVRVHGDVELGILPRVCAPVRCQSLLLGYVWIIDADQSLSDAAMEVLADAADEAGLVMYRERLLDEIGMGRERELVRDLLSVEDERVRHHAAAGLVEAERFLPDTGVVAVVARVRAGEGGGEDLEMAIAAALDRASHYFPSRSCVSLARLDRGVLLAAQKPSREAATTAAAGALQSLLGKSFEQVRVGIGLPQPRLADAHVSHRQALQAALIAESVASFGPVVAWADLGVYRLLAAMPATDLGTELLHPGLRALIDDPKSGHLVATLETYLDLAGDVKATSERLSLHRTSLYYRLGRVEALTGASLASGEDRLALHLGIKLARFCGLYDAR